MRSTNALWIRNNVPGLRIVASLATRRGRTNSVVKPSTNRSNVVRLGRRASTGAAADNQLVLEQQRLGDDGADAAGAREPGQGDEQMYHEKKQVAHRRARLPGIPVSTRLLACWVSRYDRRIRTPQVNGNVLGNFGVKEAVQSYLVRSGVEQRLEE